MILALLRIEPSSAKRLEALELLRSVQGPTQDRTGCLSCRVYEEEGPERAIVYCERWVSSADFHEHVRSDLYRRILAALDLSECLPEVGVYEVARTEGMELIQQIRGSADMVMTGEL